MRHESELAPAGKQDQLQNNVPKTLILFGKQPHFNKCMGNLSSITGGMKNLVFLGLL